MATLGVHSLQTLSKITFGSIAIDKKKKVRVFWGGWEETGVSREEADPDEEVESDAQCGGRKQVEGGDDEERCRRDSEEQSFMRRNIQRG